MVECWNQLLLPSMSWFPDSKHKPYTSAGRQKKYKKKTILGQVWYIFLDAEYSTPKQKNCQQITSSHDLSFSFSFFFFGLVTNMYLWYLIFSLNNYTELKHKNYKHNKKLFQSLFEQYYCTPTNGHLSHARYMTNNIKTII